MYQDHSVDCRDPLDRACASVKVETCPRTTACRSRHSVTVSMICDGDHTHWAMASIICWTQPDIDRIEISQCNGTPDGWLCSLLGEVQQGPAALKFDSERFRSAPRTNGNVIFFGRKGVARIEVEKRPFCDGHHSATRTIALTFLLGGDGWESALHPAPRQPHS